MTEKMEIKAKGLELAIEFFSMVSDAAKDEMIRDGSTPITSFNFETKDLFALADKFIGFISKDS